MADRMASGDTASATEEANLNAFLRHRDDVPRARLAALIDSLGVLRGSDDPVVTFAGLPRACVPGFADGCQVELSNGAEPPFRVAHPVTSADGPGRTAAHPAGPGHMLLTPFRVVSPVGYPSYAGVVTYWWTSRAPAKSDAVIADLVVRHLIALVDHERLMVTVARADDRAASLALEAISGRTINLAVGIVMHQYRLAAEDAEGLLRRAGAVTMTSLYEMATHVVRSGALADPPPDTAPVRQGSGPRDHLRPVDLTEP